MTLSSSASLQSTKSLSLGVDSGESAVVSPVEWDAFLQANAQGQFQQSAMWGEFKSSQGWTCGRLIGRAEDGTVVAGCQVLMKVKRGLRFGYISKGPVVTDESAASARDFFNRLREFARRERLAALLIQPPDYSRHWDRALQEAGCIPCPHLGIISATIAVDLADGPSVVAGRYSKTTEQGIRQASRRAVKVREAGAADVGTFFELVRQTCERKGVTPNPGSAKSFQCLYQAFARYNAIRITLAEENGVPIGGVLCIRFGNTVTLWKKGATPAAFRSHAMDLLYHDALEWGGKTGHAKCDFGGTARELAEAVSAGRDITPEQRRSDDFFHVRFGGKPRLLPIPRLYVPNPLARPLLKLGLSLRTVQRLLQRQLA